MASFRLPKILPWKAPQGVHLLLAVGVPAAFSALIVFWTTGQGPVGPWAPLGVAYGLILSLWAAWRQRTHRGGELKAWFWLMATIVLYGALAWAEGLPWPRTLALEGAHLAWFLVALTQGQLSALWSGHLASRARLFQLIDGVPEGKPLEDRVREFQLDADFSKANQTALTTSLGFFGFAAVIVAQVSPYGRGGLSAGLLAGFLVLCVMVGVLLRTYRREMEALIYGRRFTWGDKLAPLGWSSALVLGAGLGAWGMLSVDPWSGWTQWVPPLIENAPEPVTALRPPPAPEPAVGGDYRWAFVLILLQRILRVHHLGLVVEAFLRVTAALAPWALGAVLVWPMVRWILSGGKETRGLGRRWWRLIRTQIQTFLAALWGWRRRRQPWTEAARIPTGSGRVREWIQTWWRSRGQRRRHPEVVEAFLRLVDWAQPWTTYRTGETTREFLDRLAQLAVPAAENLAVVRDLLDRDLFSRRGLTVEERRQLLDRVSLVVTLPSSHGSTTEVS